VKHAIGRSLKFQIIFKENPLLSTVAVFQLLLLEIYSQTTSWSQCVICTIGTEIVTIKDQFAPM